MSNDKRIINGRLQGKLELQSRTALATQWLDGQIAYLETLRDVGMNMETILDGLEQSGMKPLTLEPLREAVEGLDHSLTLQKLEGLRATVHDGTMSEAAMHPKVRSWLSGAMRSPQAINDAVMTIVERIPNDAGTNMQALEGSTPLLVQEMQRLTTANRSVLEANVAYLGGRALADAADISRQ